MLASGCVFLFAFVQSVFSMKAFEPLEPGDELYTRFETLLRSEDSKALNLKLPEKERVDPYSLAVSLARSLDELVKLKEPLSPDSAGILYSLIHDLAEELEMLKRDPKESRLRLESLQNRGFISTLTPKETIEPGFQLHSVKVEGEFPSRGDKNYLKSFLHLAYQGFRDLEANFKFASRNSVGKTEPRPFSQSETQIPEWSLSLGNRVGLDEIKVGRYSSNLGLGVGISSPFQGIEARKQYKDYEFRLGYHNGLFGALTVPAILEIPFTLYTLQEKNPTNTGVNLSGVSFLHNWGKVRLGSEYVESSGLANSDTLDRSAVSFLVGYQPTRSLNLRSSLTHTGLGFQAGRGWNPESNWYYGISNSVQEKISRSLSRYFGRNITHLPGFSDLGMSLSYDFSASKSFRLSWNYAYDHTPIDIHHESQFQVAAMEFDWGIRKDSILTLRLEKLLWDQAGSISQGLFGTSSNENAFHVESGIKMKF
ncbi:hypothetical protein HOF92_07845 [bacterium]|jgi:hypothetical protein|nr:hypothetical protein [bacterium]